MKLTKDESRILSVILNDAKYEFVNENKRCGLFDALENLQIRLKKTSKDTRRNGRTSQDDFNDCVKRFIAKNC